MSFSMLFQGKVGVPQAMNHHAALLYGYAIAAGYV
jgi:hypothetical protein